MDTTVSTQSFHTTNARARAQRNENDATALRFVSSHGERMPRCHSRLATIAMQPSSVELRRISAHSAGVTKFSRLWHRCPLPRALRRGLGHPAGEARRAAPSRGGGLSVGESSDASDMAAVGAMRCDNLQCASSRARCYARMHPASDVHGGASRQHGHSIVACRAQCIE